MSKMSLPFRNTGYFSSLISDLVEQHPRLSSFVSRFPSIDNFLDQIEEKEACYSIETRKTLSSNLKDQYAPIKDNKVALSQIELLKEKNTFTVTTGHQLNLMTGPLYFIYKIISTINLCNQLKKKYPTYNFIPIYWMASEDHDFDEISFFHFQGKKIKWNVNENGAVGRLSLESLQSVLDVFEQNLGSNANAKQLRLMISNSYRSSNTLAEATFKLVHQLFGQTGLLVLEPDTPSLKSLLIPFILNELTKYECETCVNKSIDELKEKYDESFKPQVNPREINLFYLTKNTRERIVQTPDGFSTVDTNKQFTREEMIKEVEIHPERFSPNVLMRPLYQETILPNLAYVGGGGEIAYWLELKNYFTSQRVPFPLLFVRNSVMLIPSKSAKKIQKLQLDVVDLFMKRNALINKKIRQISNIDLDLQDFKKQLEVQFATLTSLVEETDASFKGALEAQKVKQFKGIDNLEKRLLKAQKKKLVDHVSRLTILHETLFPGESLQERKANFFDFYLEYGEKLIPLIQENLNPFSFDFTCLIIED